MAERIRVVGLHKLPFGQAAFENDIALLGDRSPAELAKFREQYKENWDNAWLVVIEFEGDPRGLDFGDFGYAITDDALRNRDRMQAAYLEKILDSSEGKVHAAFYIHYIDPKRPLWYGRKMMQPIRFPEPTSASPDLLKQLPYESPD